MAYMRTDELIDLLRVKYNGSAYAFFTNVADGTGGNASRWADGMAISLWPSRGLTIEGFELKVSRSDWQREMANPAKAEAVCKYCDYWWVVISEAGIVKDDELPATWGLMCATEKADGLRVKVKAPRLEPVPLDRHIVAAIARRAVEQTADAQSLEAAKQEGIEAGKLMRDFELRDFDQLKERVVEFQKVTGIDLGTKEYRSTFHWSKPEDIGKAVLMVLEGEASYQQQLSIMRNAAKRVLEIIGDVEPEVKKRRRA